jgi:hypothetical protein
VIVVEGEQSYAATIPMLHVSIEEEVSCFLLIALMVKIRKVCQRLLAVRVVRFPDVMK